MAFKDFSENLFVRAIDTGETINLGGFTVANDIELQHLRVKIYIEDVTALGGSETYVVKAFGQSDFTNELFTSSTMNVSDITNIGTDNWLGFVRVDFNRQNMNASTEYYFSIEFSNYTRNGELFFIAGVFDFPFPVYDNSETAFNRHPIATQIFGYS